MMGRLDATNYNHIDQDTRSLSTNFLLQTFLSGGAAAKLAWTGIGVSIYGSMA
jgi:hypothetical protein